MWPGLDGILGVRLLPRRPICAFLAAMLYALAHAAQMFASASAFNQPIGSWNTARVVDMSGAFNRASSFNGDIAGWNTASVSNMFDMFDSAAAFNLNVAGWNTASVKDMSQACSLPSHGYMLRESSLGNAYVRTAGMLWLASRCFGAALVLLQCVRCSLPICLSRASPSMHPA
jgi:surface protein